MGLNMKLQNGIAEEENLINKSKTHQKSSEQSTPQAPQESNKETEPVQEEDNVSKPEMATMGFRAEVDKMNLWKIYADAAGKKIGAMCTSAIDEYIQNHQLTNEQKRIFDIKMNALKQEKKIKNEQQGGY